MLAYELELKSRTIGHDGFGQKSTTEHLLGLVPPSYLGDHMKGISCLAAGRILVFRGYVEVMKPNLNTFWRLCFKFVTAL